MNVFPRVARLCSRFSDLGVEAVIVTAPANIRYLTGFSGEGWVLVDEAAVIITDGRYMLRAEEEAPEVEVIECKNTVKASAIEWLEAKGVRRVGFEADHLTVAVRDDLQQALPTVQLVPLNLLLSKDRVAKDADEIELLRKAVAVTDEAFGKIAQNLQPGVTEVELALEIQRQLLLAGAERLAFEVIAASGPNSADPHAEPTHRVLQEGDIVKLDFGAAIGGYRADLTRTLFLGDPDAQQQEIYRVVLEAQLAAIESCAPEALGRDADAVARQIIKEAGYGEQFRHSLGHGVGLQVHELPRLSTNSEDVLRPGMVVTVEPGIYLKEWGGIRIEDIVLITEEGHEVLTRAPKLDFGCSS
ncbi:MAG: M24 family metallopeptidase [Candidatus Zipacnadales bacterium]